MTGHAVVWAARKTEGEREGRVVWPALVTLVSVRHFRSHLSAGGRWTQLFEGATRVSGSSARVRVRDAGGWERRWF